MAGRKPGAPKTGGRKKGTPNRTSAAREQAIADSGLTPLDYMLQVMRDLGADDARRLDAAKAAAPFVHPKLSSVEMAGPNGGPVEAITRIELVDLDGNGAD